MIHITKVGDWVKAAQILGSAPAQLRIAMDRAVLAEAQYFRTLVVQGIRDQAPGGRRFQPLSPNTLMMRRFRGINSTKALLVHGDLRNSISVIKNQRPFGVEAWVGVRRNAKGRNGQSLYNIARIHEFGSRPIVIPVTDKMRRFFFAALRKSGKGSNAPGANTGGFVRGFIIVRIPARPFIQPVADAYFSGPSAAARFQARVAANLGILGGIGVSASATVAATVQEARAAAQQAVTAAQQQRRRSYGGPSRDPRTSRFIPRNRRL